MKAQLQTWSTTRKKRFVISEQKGRAFKGYLLRSAGSIVRPGVRAVIARALVDAGATATPEGEDGLLVQAGADQVGRIAFAAGVPVRELRPADGAGLEEMFLQLTAGTQRDSARDNNLEGALA